MPDIPALLLIRRPKFTSKELGDIRRPQRVATIAIEAAEFTASRFDQYKPHGFVYFVAFAQAILYRGAGLEVVWPLRLP
jgi:hypothetical protein